MRAGYVWDFGPFEYWDLIGFQNGIDMIEAAGEKIPIGSSKCKSRFRAILQIRKGEKKYFDLTVKPTKQYPDLTPVSFWKVSVKVLL